MSNAVMNIGAILTPAEITRLPQRDLRGTTCIVFDVLRATSTMLTALSAGARRIHPVSTIEEARLLKGTQHSSALLGGERGGVRIEGFDLGNSPREYTAPAVAGRDIISTTTNGTVALRACAGAATLLAGAWLNLDALACWLLTHLTDGDHLLLVCAGTGEHFALEDGFAVGGLLARLTRWEGTASDLTPRAAVTMDDASTALLALYSAMSSDPVDALRRSANGRRLAEIGLGADVEWCAATTALPWIAIMRGAGLEGERVEVPR